MKTLICDELNAACSRNLRPHVYLSFFIRLIIYPKQIPMQASNLSHTILKILDRIETLIPSYMAIEEDRIKANGSVAACIIDADGNIYGRIFGDDKILGRERYRIAWIKASQVWITGIKTGEFEKLAFTNQIDEKKFGIRRPDYIGWEGGQPVTLPDGTIISTGVSGFRSVSDLEIVVKAIAMMG
jgi:uncharacterized protein GlcG (DUF336 family)